MTADGLCIERRCYDQNMFGLDLDRFPHIEVAQINLPNSLRGQNGLDI